MANNYVSPLWSQVGKAFLWLDVELWWRDINPSSNTATPKEQEAEVLVASEDVLMQAAEVPVASEDLLMQAANQRGTGGRAPCTQSSGQ